MQHQQPAIISTTSKLMVEMAPTPKEYTGAADFAVKADDGQYYAGTLDEETGEVSWDSSSTALASTDVNVAGGAQTQAVISSVETVADVPEGSYVLQGQDEFGNDATYEADVQVNQTSGTITSISIAQDADGKDVQLTVDALSTLDNALSQIDSFRSDLGAVQNRFEDAITNLSTNETNLSAARSRIEDADYAMEVADMTRAQILQQANQLPQNVLSLLG
ncbi:flagellin [Halomonas sp. MES3-P3E]|uniref:flagellin n=1 Tax=Halomonas sp. MES3-P3E TaxID=2058321 RepID=UPI002FCDD516